MSDVHERVVHADGRLQFQLTSEAAPEMDCGGASLRLLSAVEGFDGAHEISLEVRVGERARTVDLEPRGGVDLPEGRLTFRYLQSGATEHADFEYLACFEWSPE